MHRKAARKAKIRECPVPMAVPRERRAISKCVQDLIDYIRSRVAERMSGQRQDPYSYLRCIAAVNFGHANEQLGLGRAMTAKQIAHYIRVSERTIRARLVELLKHGIVVRIGQRYYIAPDIADDSEMIDDYMKIFDAAYDGIAAVLADYRGRNKAKR